MWEQITLSTANNSESDVDFSSYSEVDGATSADIRTYATMARSKIISVASKTVYYQNIKSGAITSIYVAVQVPNIIRAVCAYL